MENKNIVLDEASQARQTKSVHKLGRASGLVCIVAMLLVPLITMLYYGISLDMGGFGTALSALSAFIVVGVVEVISYGPILGPGATYLAFITGNVSNMKLPAAVSGMSIANAEPGSLKGKTVATLAVGISSIVTTLVVFLGMLFLSQMLPVLQNPVLAPAFNNMIYALMGAFAAPIVAKNLKGASVPFVIMAAIVLFNIKIHAALQMPIMLAVAVLWAYVLHRVEAKKGVTGNA